MIFNRNLNDVKDAIKIREEKVKKNVELSEDDLETLEKGFLTIETLNRIEQKQKELSEEFSRNGYFNSKTENKTWNDGDSFLITDFERILRNSKILKDSFFVFSYTPTNATNKTYYENLNKIEKMLFDLQTMIDDMKSRYRICGTFYCGG